MRIWMEGKKRSVVESVGDGFVGLASLREEGWGGFVGGVLTKERMGGESLILGGG